MWAGPAVGGNSLAGGKFCVCPMPSNPVLRGVMWAIRGVGE